ncbi:hypothetical protein BDV96DRAFT_604089 [Lophiotrema nucula]|uniref:Uncharacterized protein n=1 Tax=Lophiotrema nucula TaxID=690887 RepID=A0A6A5YU27_9PLEO|nr:hypothetical protein BDV96DRAFT_604089 [Lophiotrema nucula]
MPLMTGAQKAARAEKKVQAEKKAQAEKKVQAEKAWQRAREEKEAQDQKRKIDADNKKQRAHEAALARLLKSRKAKGYHVTRKVEFEVEVEVTVKAEEELEKKQACKAEKHGPGKEENQDGITDEDGDSEMSDEDAPPPSPPATKKKDAKRMKTKAPKVSNQPDDEEVLQTQFAAPEETTTQSRKRAHGDGDDGSGEHMSKKVKPNTNTKIHKGAQHKEAVRKPIKLESNKTELHPTKVSYYSPTKLATASLKINSKASPSTIAKPRGPPKDRYKLTPNPRLARAKMSDTKEPACKAPPQKNKTGSASAVKAPTATSRASRSTTADRNSTLRRERDQAAINLETAKRHFQRAARVGTDRAVAASNKGERHANQEQVRRRSGSPSNENFEPAGSVSNVSVRNAASRNNRSSILAGLLAEVSGSDHASS